MNNKAFVFSVILFMFSVFSDNVIFDSDAKADNDVVAVVNGQKLSRNELAAILIDVYGREGIDRLIRRTLVKQEAKKVEC